MPVLHSFILFSFVLFCFDFVVVKVILIKCYFCFVVQFRAQHREEEHKQKTMRENPIIWHWDYWEFVIEFEINWNETRTKHLIANTQDTNRTSPQTINMLKYKMEKYFTIQMDVNLTVIFFNALIHWNWVWPKWVAILMNFIANIL